MTDFRKLFMVKINKMIKKKTGGIFLVVYVIYDSLVHTDSKKTESCLLARQLPSYYIPSIMFISPILLIFFFFGGGGALFREGRLSESGRSLDHLQEIFAFTQPLFQDVSRNIP